MAVLKCKMCGGNIIAAESQTFGTCDSCGSIVTIPYVNDARMENMFNRANHFRMICEFDKAVATYEMILNEDNNNAEAHWGLLISRHGIEYVEDPTSHERIPTCHRIQTESILADSDYLSSLEFAPDSYTRTLYESEGARLADLQRELLHVSSQAEPFDVFICYKETSDGGNRTKDSALAQDIYYQLTNAGYRVFFSRITLENILGQQYEPYIFAALNSAKIMLVIGTKPEYFNAVWVRNEWSRFLALAKKDKSKILIPCYRDMNVYDLPDELSLLQSQDMGKIGFVQDLLYGIEKIVHVQDVVSPTNPTLSQITAPGLDSLYKRAMLFLEDGDFVRANEYFDRLLDIDPEFAPAYIGKLCVENQLRSEAELESLLSPIANDNNFKKALRFANAQLKTKYEGYNQAILNHLAAIEEEKHKKEVEEKLLRKKQEQLRIYNGALQRMKSATRKADFIAAAASFDSLLDYKDAPALARECRSNASECEIKEKQEEEQQRIQAKKHRIKTIKILITAFAFVAIIVSSSLLYTGVIKPADDYKSAFAAYESKNYDEAIAMFSRLGNYKDAANMVLEANYQKGLYYLESNAYDAAINIFSGISDYQDSATMVLESRYQKGISLLNTNNYIAALKQFNLLSGYKDSSDLAQESQYQRGMDFLDSDQFDSAKEMFIGIQSYKNASDMISECEYQKGMALLTAGKYDAAKQAFNKIPTYKDALVMAKEAQYQKGLTFLESGDYTYAEYIFNEISDYKDADIIVQETQYQKALNLFNEGEYVLASYAFSNISEYSNASTLAKESQYQRGLNLLSEGEYDTAVSVFNSITDYKDAATQASESQYLKGRALLDSGKYDAATEIFNNITDYKDAATRASESQYLKGRALLDSDKYDAATEIFNNITDYKDAATRALESQYLKGEALLEDCEYGRALLAFGEAKDYQDSVERYNDLFSRLTNSISVDHTHMVGLNSGRRVFATGDNTHGQCDVDNWFNIISIVAGEGHTVGLRKDNTVIATGLHVWGQCDVEDWTDIIAVDAGNNYTVGLKKDGTVVVASDSRFSETKAWKAWKDITAVAAGRTHLVGLKADGTVVATGHNAKGECNVEEWSNIIAIAAGYEFTLGLKADGTVVATGNNTYGQCDVERWSNIKHIDAGYYCSVGMKKDNTFVVTNENDYFDTWHLKDWTDVVAVAAGGGTVMGVRVDGTIVYDSMDHNYWSGTSSWKLW